LADRRARPEMSRRERHLPNIMSSNGVFHLQGLASAGINSPGGLQATQTV
jgi:hypothetical protein